jgi:hypothetical protein
VLLGQARYVSFSEVRVINRYWGISLVAISAPSSDGTPVAQINWIAVVAVAIDSAVRGLRLVFGPAISDLARFRTQYQTRGRGWQWRHYKPLREYYCPKKLLYRDSSLVSVIDQRLIDGRNKSQHEFSIYH